MEVIGLFHQKENLGALPQLVQGKLAAIKPDIEPHQPQLPKPTTSGTSIPTSSPTATPPHAPASSSPVITSPLQRFPSQLQNLLAKLPMFQTADNADNENTNNNNNNINNGYTNTNINTNNTNNNNNNKNVDNNNITGQEQKRRKLTYETESRNFLDLTLSPVRVDEEREGELREILLKVCACEQLLPYSLYTCYLIFPFYNRLTLSTLKRNN